jgi:hypothetical protein
MSRKADYVDEEWTRLVRAPFVAGLALSIADPGGPIEMAHETMATLKAATTPPSREQLLLEVAADITAAVNEKANPLKGFKPDNSALAGKMILDELATVNTILDAKATPEEAEGFRRWLLDVARDAANAAKEGGFMGFHAVRVSEGEERMLQQMRETLGSTEA